MNYDFQIFLG